MRHAASAGVEHLAKGGGRVARRRIDAVCDEPVAGLDDGLDMRRRLLIEVPAALIAQGRKLSLAPKVLRPYCLASRVHMEPCPEGRDRLLEFFGASPSTFVDVLVVRCACRDVDVEVAQRHYDSVIGAQLLRIEELEARLVANRHVARVVIVHLEHYVSRRRYIAGRSRQPHGHSRLCNSIHLSAAPTLTPYPYPQHQPNHKLLSFL